MINEDEIIKQGFYRKLKSDNKKKEENMKSKRSGSNVIVMVIVCFVVFIGFNAQSITHAAKLEKSVIKIGYAGGINYVFGKQMLQAAQDAVEEVNNNGGVLGSKLEIVAADTGLTAAGATSAIAKLTTSDKVDFIIGAYTSEEATAFHSEANKRKIISFIHVSTLRFDDSYKANPEENKFTFGVSSSEIQTAETSIDFMPFAAKKLQQKLGLKKVNVAIVSDNALWTVNIDKVMKEACEKYKDIIDLVYFTKPARNATDFTTEITEFIKKDVHLIMVFGGYGSVIPFVKQFNQMQVPAILGGAIILAMTPDDFIKAVGKENAAYVTTTALYTHVSSPRDAKLVSEFKAKHGAYPGHYAGEGYNMIKLLVKSLEKAGTINPDELIPVIETTVVPKEETWGGGPIRLVNHRLQYDYAGENGIRKYAQQYSPEGEIFIIYPEEKEMLIPPQMYKKWKK